MKHAGIRTRLIVTYFTSVAVAVTLGPLVYHGVASLLGWTVAPDVWMLVLVMVAAAGISLVYGFLVGRGIVRQIGTLTAGAQRLATGDLGTRIVVRGKDELAELGATLNEMASRLQQALGQQQKLEQARRELVANVAHDLRTPLAAIQATVEALEEGIVEDGATRAHYLATIGQETRYLGRLIDDLFALSRLEAGQFELKPEAIYPEDIVQECLAGLLPDLERAQIALDVDLPATLPPIRADGHATRRVLLNLLQNALAYTPSGGQISIHGAGAAGAVQIEVDNSGAGLAPRDLEPGPAGLPRIFDRFYRGDRGRSGGGAGLGLAIARELVEAQGGEIWARSMPGEGTTIGFSLPSMAQP